MMHSGNMGHDALNQVLRTGRQRQRGAAALDLTMCQPGTPLYNTSASGLLPVGAVWWVDGVMRGWL
jgi:hypothetical protein